jgi:signal transduction histidine kinase
MRRVVALAVGLVVSTLLLGGGWLWATHRERESRLSEARERLSHVADAVRAAVDESLEELRAREDQRPFYLYNHYYSPPDVLAITDPVAISPLAHPPNDPRVRGYFQIEPGGGVRTPHAIDAASEPAFAQSLRATLASEAFAPIRALAVGDQLGTMLAAPPMRGDPRRDDALEARPDEAPVESPLMQMSTWGNIQVQDIQAAQAGDSEASARLIQRGRQVPSLSRRNVSWEEVERNQITNNVARSTPQVSRPPRPSRAAVRTFMESARGAALECTSATPLVVRVTVGGAEGRVTRVEVEGTRDPEALRCLRAVLTSRRLAPFVAESLLVRYAYRGGSSDALVAAIPSDHQLDNIVQRAAEVDYTPMIFRRIVDGDARELVMHRAVSHEGATVVQGVLLDRRELIERWIPSVARRRGERGVELAIVEAGHGECALRRPASSILADVELCVSPATLIAATAPIDAELGWQIGALAALWLMALLAAFAIVATARRAEALSRQKSAFVSAVSHELRTPLTTLRMHAEMLEEGLVSDERRPKVYGELVRESVRLARLVDNVLTLSKLEEGRRRIRVTDGDLRAHVRDVVEGQRRWVIERGFTLRGPEGEAPLDARLDAQAIEQIVVNLIDNAVKYGVGEERAIEVEVAMHEGAPTLFVRDRGPGIPAHERTKVFERFHRVEREEHAHAPGTGIGLALVAELAEAHGGAASVHPREGGGLEVRVRLGASIRVGTRRPRS